MAPDELDIQFTTAKDVLQEDVLRARESVARALAHTPRPVLYTRWGSSRLTPSDITGHRIPLHGGGVTAERIDPNDEPA